MWRGELGIVVALVLAASSVARADDGNALASPWRPSHERAAAPDAEEGTLRIYGDGGGADLGWDDPERDLEPSGPVHFLIAVLVAYLGGDGPYAEGVDFGLAPALDVCLYAPLSLHLRVGARIGAHGPLGVTSRTLGTGYVRATLFLGAHIARYLALRVGMEVGPELIVASGRSSGDFGAGGAAVAQIGVRIPGGLLELALDLAVDIRPGSELVGPGVTTQYSQASPRVGAFLGATF